MLLDKPRSFIRRERKMTPQARASFEKLWLKYGLKLEDGSIDAVSIFGRLAPLIFEIGFGSGESLIASAKANPHQNHLGVEVYSPGIANTMAELAKQGLENVRIYNIDALDVLRSCIVNYSLDEVRLLFPDPWPKRRHHKRRLVQNFFVELLHTKLKPGGTFYFITDWEDYAVQVKKIISQRNDFAVDESLPDYLSAVKTKFRQRGLQAGRKICELAFKSIRLI